MQMLKMCLNWKVLAGLTAVGIGIYLVAPNLVAAALPILLLAACPLSMLLMMLMMKDTQGSQGEASEPRLSPEHDPSLTREEQLVRLRWDQAAVADRIDALVQEEPRSTGRQRRDADADTGIG
ncbi:MAG: DUF2933 domain-containing protein [Actinobacteria bacterium]|nr:DUF2933 domain-containing protein [Actinomycetota bacterium]